MAVTNTPARWKYLALGSAVGVVLAAAALWNWLRPRAIRVVVVSDFGFRERRNWDKVLTQRFAAVNRLFEGTGVQWQVLNAEHLDPAANAGDLDTRRLELERQEATAADVVVSFTGQGEGDRLGAVVPFTHAAIVVDFPQQNEEQNTLILAHDLAVLFGAAIEPAGSETVMAVPPRNAAWPRGTAELIHKLRGYDFAGGIGSLKDRWERKAVDALAEAYTHPSPKPLAHAHITLALALDAEKHAAEGVPEAREAVKADPQSIDARQALAHALMDDSQVEAATRELREAVRLFPKNAALHGFLGILLGNQSATEEAIAELSTAERLDPKNANYPVAMGSLMVSQTGQVEEAVAEFQKANQLDPRLAAAQYWLHRMNDLNQQAMADLEVDRRKVREAPQDPGVHYALGVDEARLGHHEQARAEFQKTVELDPRNGRAWSDLAAMEYYGNDYESAKKHVIAARAVGFEPPAPLVAALERKGLKGDAGMLPGGEKLPRAK